jgi:hypothetical protein
VSQVFPSAILNESVDIEDEDEDEDEPCGDETRHQQGTFGREGSA